jgi:hypothetical protein
MTELSLMPFAPVRVETGAGTLVLHPQRFDDIGALAELSPDDAPGDRLRRFFGRVAAREGGPQGIAKSPRLDDETRALLTDADVERVAEAYLALPDVRAVAHADKQKDAAVARGAGEAATLYLDRLLRSGHERQMADVGATYETLCARYGESLSEALADLDRQALELRDAVARLAASDVPRPAPAVPAGAPLLDVLVAEEERGHRAIEDAVLLTRGLAQITTRAALLLAGASESATAYLRNAATTMDATVHAAQRRITVMAASAASLAGMAVVIAALGLWQEREHAGQVQRSQEILAQVVKDNAAAQDAGRQASAAALRELAEGQAATAATLKVALAALPAPGSGETGGTPKHETAKPAAGGRGNKRKANTR